MTTSEGAWIENPQGVAAMVEKVRRKPGGRFRVTPVYNLVIVYGEAGGGMAPFLVGRLEEPFRLREDAPESLEELDIASLLPGVLYRGPTDRAQGMFKLRQKRGGLIERKVEHLRILPTSRKALTPPRTVGGFLQRGSRSTRWASPSM